MTKNAAENRSRRPLMPKCILYICALLLVVSCGSGEKDFDGIKDSHSPDYTSHTKEDSDSEMASDLSQYLYNIEQEIANLDYIEHETKEIINALKSLINNRCSYKGDWGEAISFPIHDLYHKKDPKTAPILVDCLCDPDIRAGGVIVHEAISNLGIYSVPYLIKYIDSKNTAMWAIIDILAAISNDSPIIMKDILNHIIIPKIESELKKDDEGSHFLLNYAMEDYSNLKSVNEQLNSNK